MDKKLFEELMEGLNQMADHAAGKHVEGSRVVVKEAKTPQPLSKEKKAKLRKRSRPS